MKPSLRSGERLAYRLLLLALVAVVAVGAALLAPASLAAPDATTGKRTAAASESVPAQYRGKIIRKRVRYFPKKLLALTFDDGPSTNITPQVLRVLEKHGAKATFFVLGRSVKAHPEIVRQAAQAGHAIGVHSYSHPSRATAAQAASELDRTAALIAQVTGKQPVLFRPPYGITNGNLCRLALKRNYSVILWTISSADSNPIGSATIARNTIHTPNPGDIVLMHDAAGKKATLGALPQILTELSAAGFRFVTVPELMRAWDEWEKTQQRTKHAK
ncbi:MAG: polysaccharide deacetylase family protein [Armatimonadia bacterium]